MYRGTNGCMYNCGDICTRECMKPMDDGISKKEQMLDQEITDYKIKPKFDEEGNILSYDIIVQQEDAVVDWVEQDVKDNYVIKEDFPITFENEYGKWEIHSDGNIYVQPKKALQHIECNITIKPTETYE